MYPDDCLLLVDTIDTLGSGIPNAIKVFGELRRRGHEPIGVRLDSGDLAYLSIQAARMLDEAGFADTTIVLSNQLDELVIWQILTQIKEEAPKYGMDPERLMKRLAYGVGTRLIASQGHAALDGVYKLTAVQQDGGQWLPAYKVSESPEKAINPGRKDAWRIYDRRDKATADLLTLHREDPTRQDPLFLQHPIDPDKYRVFGKDEISAVEPLLEDVLHEGKRVSEYRSIEDIRKVRIADLERLDIGVKRLVNPHMYHVSVSKKLWRLKQQLVRPHEGDQGTTR
jgi:nicotinate phosphoribosyltransferase